MATRSALVGGGGTGIGRATAEALLRAGHRVAITGRRADVLATAAAELAAWGEPLTAVGVDDGTASQADGPAGGDVLPIVADLADAASAQPTIDAVTSRFGTLDVLVVNAGGPPPGRILDLDDDQWQTAFELLVRGPLRLARLALPSMAAHGFGRVVFVTSTAVRQPQPDLAASVVLRSALTAAAKLLSREYATSGVTVNCVAPGPTATDRRREILSARAARTGSSYDALDKEDAATVPAGRAGQPAEIAAAVAFLASEQASYVNGTVLTVDGGRTETI